MSTLSPSAALAPVTVVVLTMDEAANLPRCLDSVRGWASEVFVVDSGSTDGTVEIARLRGAKVVTHDFTTHALQWRWALAELPLTEPWVLGLDADQSLTVEARDEVLRHLRGATGETAGYYLRRRQVFRGRWIRHGGYYPKYLLKLFRRDAVTVGPDLVDHRFQVRGRVERLEVDLVEDNAKEGSIGFWIDKHNRYAALQAREELAARQAPGALGWPPFLGTPDDRTLWLKRLWLRLPLYARPALYFVYRYLFRLGFLDRKEGFLFHFLQAFWYRLLVDVKLEELLSGEGALPRPAAGPLTEPR